MEKVIFLDVDGVLNSIDYYENSEKRLELHREKLNKRAETDKLTSYDIFRQDIDDKAVSFLQEIINKTGAKIVISSHWRTGETFVALKEILSELKFSGEIIGVTPNRDCSLCVRGNVIQEWINKNRKVMGEYPGHKQYVIIDDDSDMLLCQKDNFVQTSLKNGLTAENVNKAIEILNRK